MTMLKKMSIVKIILGLSILVCVLPVTVPTQGQEQSLDQAANDPTASVMSVQLQNLYTGDYHKLENESGNTILLRSALPFKTGELNHIARATLPFITKNPSGESGMSDLVLFDLFVFNKSWGRWGIGPVMLIPTATHEKLGAEKWAAGPAAGFIARSPKLMWGVFNQNLFSFAGDNSRNDVNVSILQPIVSYSLPGKWSIGTSEMTVTYDWEKNDWSSLPIGIKVAKLVSLGKLPIQLSGAYEYNFADDEVAPAWGINLTFKMLFPI